MTAPVLVGVGTEVHRPDDGPPPTVVDLLVAAGRAAGADCGAPRLLSQTDWIGVPRGTWEHPDPGHAVAEGVGAGGARTALAEVGVLQQSLLTEGCRRAAAGGVALVVGGEAAYGSSAGAALAVAGGFGEDRDPDDHWVTEDYGVTDQEILRGFVEPPTVYAAIESAIRAEAERTVAEQRELIGGLQARFAAVTSTNPDAWTSEPVTAQQVMTAGPGNRAVADPYTKLCCSNMRVNQAAALLLCSTDTARRAGIPEDRWVYPVAATESNHAVPVIQRPELHRSPGAAVAGHRALDAAGVEPSALDHLDLYSCFPAAVQVYARELGIDLGDVVPTVTGGMTFAGGPLNNYVLQATAAMARVLRADPGTTGLITSVSGMITKQGFAVWSSAPTAAFAADDVSAAVAADSERRPEDDDVHGPAVVVAATTVHDRDGPRQAVIVAETDDGRRTLAGSGDVDVMASVAVDEWVGRTVTVDGDRFRA